MMRALNPEKLYSTWWVLKDLIVNSSMLATEFMTAAGVTAL